jgi:LacI family transcriptional regulator
MENDHIKRKVTIKQVADLAGVSPATVSRALRNNGGTRGGTREKVLKVAAQLNYSPNSLAKGLRQTRTRTIGIIFNDLNNPFYTETLDEISNELNNRGFSIIICPSNYDSECESKNIRSLISRRVEGVIMSPIDERSANLALLSEHEVETVLIDCFPYFDDKNYVYTDHRKGFTLSIEYLLNSGHKDILFMMSRQDSSLDEHLLDVYMKALERYRIPFRKELIIYADKLSIESGYRTFKKLLTEDVEGKFLNFTGIVAMNDLLALGIYKVANELGIGIPGTYSVIGYDNIEISGVVSPPLTTIHQSRRRIGKESVRILLENIEERPKEKKRTCFEPYIVVRGSVRHLM